MRSIFRLCTYTRCLRSRRFYCTKTSLELGHNNVYEDIFPNTSTEEIKKLWNSPPQCIYAGFDPTAESLHIGNLFILMNLLHWQRNGHEVIAVVGGATGLIGDPSHRKSERIEMNKFVLEQNTKSIQNDVENIFRNHEQYLYKQRTRLIPLKVVNNLDWYSDLNVISFIRDIGKYFRMGTMLGRSSVQSRLHSDTGMSFTEFSYQLFQAYDWLQLHRTYNCSFQVGGHDQMGNIVAGYDLVTKYTGKSVYGLTLPLITAEGGKKFGKSTGNVVWLSPSKSSSFQLYQFFIRAKDSDVEKLLKFFTFIPLSNINDIVENHFKAPHERRAQKILAEQVTLLVHGVCGSNGPIRFARAIVNVASHLALQFQVGQFLSLTVVEEGLVAAKRASAALYDNSIESISRMKVEELSEIFEGATIVDMYSEPGLSVYELAMKSKCFKTEHDARRIIAAGGFYVNYQKITNTEEVIVPGIHILSNNLTLLRVGKKTYHIVRWM